MLAQQKRYWAEINLDTAEKNYNIIKSRLKKETKLCCVIKADGYGHGAVQLARLYEEIGADYFAVSNIEEALQLRSNGIKLPLVILGYTPPECANILADGDIEQCVFSYEYANELNTFAEKYDAKIKIHLKLDSGMGRIGFSCKHEDADKKILDEAAASCKLNNLIPYGVFTHFAVADEGNEGREYTKNQFEYFMSAVEYLKNEHKISFKLHHCSNSAAIFEYPEFQLDMVRAGIVLYGPVSSPKVPCPGVKDVMTLKSVVAMVKTVKKGDSISYGCTFTADKEMKIATVPLGYADGFWRSNINKASFILNGVKVPIVGRVCMDQLMIDVSRIDKVKAGDEVIVIGEDNGESITVSDVAALNNTISNEIICAVGKRVPRCYIKNGKTVEIKDDII